ncbi:CHAT domain-containing protein [soil metagenome]
MTRAFLIIFIGIAALNTTLPAQSIDTSFVWADKLLLQEVSFPIVSRLSRNSSTLDQNLPPINRLAEALLINLDGRQALDFLRKGNLLAKKSLPIEQAYLLHNWSRYQYDQTDYQASVDKALASIKVIDNLKKPSDASDLVRTKSILHLGKAYLQLRKMKESRLRLDEALAFFKKDSVRYSIKLAQTYYTLGLWSRNNDQFNEAIEFYNRAIQLFEAAQYEKYFELGKCFNNMAVVYGDQGDYANAKTYYLKALDFKQHHFTDSVSLAVTYNNLGKFYSEYGNNTKAEACYDKSLSLLNENEPSHSIRIPEFLNNYGNWLLENDQYDAAEKSFKRCLRLINSKGQRSDKLLPPMISLAGVLILKKENKEARKLLDEAAVLLADSAASKRTLSQWHLRKANLYSMESEIEKAQFHYDQSLKYSAPNNTELSSETYYELGLLYLKNDQYEKAITSFKKSNSIIIENQSESNPLLSGALNMIGEVYFRNQKYDSSVFFLNLAIEKNLAIKPGDDPDQVNAVYPFELVTSFYFLSKVYYKRYEMTKDISHLEKSARYVDLGLRAVDTRRKSLAITNDQVAFDGRISEFFERAMETYYAIRQEKGEGEAMDKIFYVSELSKSQALSQALKESNLKSFSDVSSTLRKEEDNLSKELQALDLQTLRELKYGADANPDLLTEYQSELKIATQRYQKLQDSIRINLPGYYQLKYNKTLVSLADIRQDIMKSKPNTAFIQFSTGDSSIYCHVITINDQKLFRIENAAEVMRRVLAFRNQIKSRLTLDLDENAVWLYDKLLKPAESILLSPGSRIRKLVIIPDQFLCYFPFEALKPNGNPRKFLLGDYDISYGYSSTLLWQKHMEQHDHHQAHSFVGLAPVFNSLGTSAQVASRGEREDNTERFQFLPLTGNVEEVNAIRDRMVKNNVKSIVLDGINATEASFRKLDLRQYDYVHFATHGFVDMDNPENSGVAFSRNPDSKSYDDLLFTNEVYEMRFNAQLVSLSSCESGIGKLYRGEGMIGLAQAFLFAGARNLAVSLWKVDDIATRDLMIDFYNRIKGESFSSALSDAKRKMMVSKKHNHPSYWASFILIGL